MEAFGLTRTAHSSVEGVAAEPFVFNTLPAYTVFRDIQLTQNTKWDHLSLLFFSYYVCCVNLASKSSLAQSSLLIMLQRCICSCATASFVIRRFNGWFYLRFFWRLVSLEYMLKLSWLVVKVAVVEFNRRKGVHWLPWENMIQSFCLFCIDSLI